MHEDLMEEVVAEENLARALRAVIRNRGAVGIDKMTVDELEDHWQRHGEKIRAKLLVGRWTPSPVRRVEIPKPNGGKRPLGIPTVMDRVVQQALWQVLQPIFDPLFSESSYGFRPGRSAQDAVGAAQEYVREGQDWVVDIDIAQFFDHVNHDLLMRRIAEVIRDKRLLRLSGRYLRAGVLTQGVVVRSEEGTPQGGPVSPLLANLYLDALDRELARFSHHRPRWMRRKARRPRLAATVCVHRPAYSMSASGRDESRPYIPDGGHLLPTLPAPGEKSGLESRGLRFCRYAAAATFR